jgi:hypothetical protein
VDSTGSEYNSTGSYEDSNELSGSIKGEEFLGPMQKRTFLKDSALCSYSFSLLGEQNHFHTNLEL